MASFEVCRDLELVLEDRLMDSWVYKFVKMWDWAEILYVYCWSDWISVKNLRAKGYIVWKKSWSEL